MKISSKKSFCNFLQNLWLVILSSFFMFLSHPNFIFKDGLGFFAFVIYLPILICVHRAFFKNQFFLGFIFGFLSYALYSNWMFIPYREFYFIVIFSYGFLYALVFALLKILDKLFSKNGWIIQSLFLCSFEFLKTKGFLGLSYGVTAYSQWKNLYFIQICDVIGVYGLNAVLIFFSAILYSIIQKKIDRKNFHKREILNLQKNEINFNQYLKNEDFLKRFSLKNSIFALCLWFSAFTGIYIYGFIKVKTKSDYESVKITLIQNNENSWQDGIDVYSKNVSKLIQLSEESLEFYENTNIIIWPETSVVPAIVYNYNNSKDAHRHQLIKNLLNFINEKNCAFVIGNGHFENGKIYNSSLIFYPKKNVIPPNPEIYSKIHLVPFSEYFPFKKRFPKIYKWLLKNGLTDWEKGKDYKVFEYKNFNFSTLICFEDTYPELARKLYKNGAKCFISLSNDSWAKSYACQNQHLAIALFRSVENRVPFVRCATSGKSCFINSNGQIEKEAPEFCETYITYDVPIIKNQKATINSFIGDFFGYAETFLTIVLLIIQIFIVIMNKIKNR